MKPAIRIRPATEGDAVSIADGNSAMAIETEGRALQPETVLRGVQRLLGDPTRGVYFLAEVEGKPAGQLLITYEWSDWRDGWFWWIQSVYVWPAWRRQGIYRALHAHVEQLARADADVRGLRLYVEAENDAAQATYRALGMHETGYRLYETDWSARR